MPRLHNHPRIQYPCLCRYRFILHSRLILKRELAPGTTHPALIRTHPRRCQRWSKVSSALVCRSRKGDRIFMASSPSQSRMLEQKYSCLFVVRSQWSTLVGLLPPTLKANLSVVHAANASCDPERVRAGDLGGDVTVEVDLFG